MHRSFLHVLTCLLAAGCSATGPAEAPIQVAKPTGPAEAGAPRCVPSPDAHAVEDGLLVDWPAAERAKLFRLAQGGAGLVAVRSDGCTGEVVEGCKLRGSYRF